MSDAYRKLTSIKIGRMSLSDDYCFNKFRVKQSKLQATFREERNKLTQDLEKQHEGINEKLDNDINEIVCNYERRLKYLRKLIEEHEANSTEQKNYLNVKNEENLILKTQIAELERLLSLQNNIKCPVGEILGNDELKLKRCDVKNDGDIDNKDEKERINKGNTNNVNEKKIHDTELHKTCRNEVFKLLSEMRRQKKHYELQVLKEREAMRNTLQDEKMQFEKVAFKHLKNKIEKELKKTELLCTEKKYLQNTITDIIVESAMTRVDNCEISECACQVFNFVKIPKQIPDILCIKQELASVTSCKLINKLFERQKDLLSQAYIEKSKQKKIKFELRLNDLQEQLKILQKENERLKDYFYNECVDEFTGMCGEFREKLIAVENYLDEENFILRGTDLN